MGFCVAIAKQLRILFYLPCQVSAYRVATVSKSINTAKKLVLYFDLSVRAIYFSTSFSKIAEKNHVNAFNPNGQIWP